MKRQYPGLKSKAHEKRRATKQRVHVEFHMKVQKPASPASPHKLSAWLAAAYCLCRLSGFSAQLDGNRLHLKATHFQILKKFRHEGFSVWSTPKLFCRFVPKAAEVLYQGERATCESALGAELASRLMGDTPSDSTMDEQGRLYFPLDILERTGIPGGSYVSVVIRRDSIEVWKADRLAEAYGQVRTAVSRIMHRKAGFLPQHSEKSTAVQALPVHSKEDV